MTMTDKCSSYRTREKRRYVYSRETGQIVDSAVNTVGYCVGTKECDECNCGGNEAMCDFYPEKRGKCESEMADYTKLCDDLGSRLEQMDIQNERLIGELAEYANEEQNGKLVRVVRCRDCKYSRKLKMRGSGQAILECRRQNVDSFGVYPEDFCSYGKRSKDEQ